MKNPSKNKRKIDLKYIKNFMLNIFIHNKRPKSFIAISNDMLNVFYTKCCLFSLENQLSDSQFVAGHKKFEIKEGFMSFHSHE